MRELRAPYLATGAATGVLLPFVAPILAGRGFSPQSIGLLLAITSAAIVVAAPIWGQVGDVVLGRRRTLQWAVLIRAAAFILLAGRLALPLVAAAVAIQYLLQTAFSALLDSIAMHALGDERHRYGHLRPLQSLSYAIAAFAAGVIYDRAGYGAAAQVFPVTAVALVMLLQAVRDSPPTQLGARAVAPATPPGEVSGVLARDGGRASETLSAIVKAGIDLGAVSADLQAEGAKSFDESWSDLLKAIETKSRALA